ncbi:Cir1p KNAG_0G00740 [Huiozyma naganishii CBS 8797]|uniref:Probable electron transfer flavoprotein subunit beta n=1 Tax=Huiozyma naganishii (strain ATCC MYA-139 / BCRC 22969 / CBS 8797 / KCTC 17520 / NBRC 10181 / NCYC 3082 / Yp74L-3) TaxID=1071383 RepID=J7R8D6_HUIN7|nr:hypothetical protein KNAG_0G00740 [Kazachstania naganishii CBS 8797]CCK71130.1 hypothetical protein KNAG_0G00740 [Kazachstania naganishii CBS 8797]
MKILVPVKRVVDAALRPIVSQGALSTSGLKFSSNPFDEIALEEALTLQRTLGGPAKAEVHCISLGPDACTDVLRNCLARGAQHATHVKVPEGNTLEPLAVAKILHGFVKDRGFDLVLLGKQAIDDDAACTGPMLAGLLQWPQATAASRVQWSPETSRLSITSETDSGEQTVSAPLPLVVTADLRLNKPKYVGLAKLMKVKRVPIEKVDPETTMSQRLEQVSVGEPPAKKPVTMVSSVDELVSKIRDLV